MLLFQTMLVLYKLFRWDRDQQDRLLSDLHGSLVFSAALAFMAIVVGEGHTDEISRYMLVVNVLLDVCFGLSRG